MPFELRDRDHGYRQRMRHLGVGAGSDSVRRNDTVLVGVQGEKASAEHQHDNIDLVTVASFAELGIGQPERSFIRAWVDEERKQIIDLIGRAARSVAAGRTTKAQALELLGAKFVAMVQARIKAHIDPPLAQSTIDAKGSDVPLIDTGQLWSSITYIAERAF